MAYTYAGLFNDEPRSPSGRGFANALVELRLPGTLTSATFYTDRLKTAGRSADTIKTDDVGNLSVWVEPGIYEYWFNGKFIELTKVQEDNDEDNVDLAATIDPAISGALVNYYTKTAVDQLLAAIATGSITSGIGPPSNNVGLPGWVYLDLTAVDPRMYGPKGTTTWPSASVSLKGPKGDKGDPGVGATTWGGVWTNSTQYPAATQVSYNNLLWVSLVQTTGTTPGTNGNIWTQATVAGPAGASGALPLSQQLAMWTASEAYQKLSLTYDATSKDVVVSATVRWPDDATGTYTGIPDTTWDTFASYSVTHSYSGATITQPTITRDSQGRATTIPALQIVSAGMGNAYQNQYTGGY